MEQFIHECGIDRSRIIPISRGGAAAWYGVPTGIELYAMRSVTDVRVATMVHHRQTGMLKQVTITPFERQIVREVAATLKLSTYHLLHPSWMYQRLERFWHGDKGPGWLQRHVRFATPGAPTLPADIAAKLPEKYAAVRFYARPTLPLRADIEQFCAATLATIARTIPIVLLGHTLPLDDHVDFKPPSGVPVIRLTDLCPVTPENNLALQSAVIAKAQGFVGTYGGLSQLALRYGKPTVTVYSEWHSTCLQHRFLSEALAVQLGVPFHVLKVGELPLLQQVLPKVQLAS